MTNDLYICGLMLLVVIAMIGGFVLEQIRQVHSANSWSLIPANKYKDVESRTVLQLEHGLELDLKCHLKLGRRFLSAVLTRRASFWNARQKRLVRAFAAIERVCIEFDPDGAPELYQPDLVAIPPRWLLQTGATSITISETQAHQVAKSLGVPIRTSDEIEADMIEAGKL